MEGTAPSVPWWVLANGPPRKLHPGLVSVAGLLSAALDPETESKTARRALLFLSGQFPASLRGQTESDNKSNEGEFKHHFKLASVITPALEISIST